MKGKALDVKGKETIFQPTKYFFNRLFFESVFVSEWTTTHQQPKIIVLIRSCKENHAGRKAGLVIDIAWPVVAWPV